MFLLCRGLNFYVARFSSHGTESGGRIKRNMVKLLVDLKRKNYHQNCKKSGSELLTNMESMI